MMQSFQQSIFIEGEKKGKKNTWMSCWQVWCMNFHHTTHRLITSPSMNASARSRHTLHRGALDYALQNQKNQKNFPRIWKDIASLLPSAGDFLTLHYVGQHISEAWQGNYQKAMSNLYIILKEASLYAYS